MFRDWISSPAGPPTAPQGGAATAAGPGGWEPTVLWMLGLVIAEIFAIGFLSRHLLS
jgi:hypothetical protein